MGNPKGFIEVPRKEAGNRPVKERIFDFGEVELPCTMRIALKRKDISLNTSWVNTIS